MAIIISENLKWTGRASQASKEGYLVSFNDIGFYKDDNNYYQLETDKRLTSPDLISYLSNSYNFTISSINKINQDIQTSSEEFLQLKRDYNDLNVKYENLLRRIEILEQKAYFNEDSEENSEEPWEFTI